MLLLHQNFILLKYNVWCPYLNTWLIITTNSVFRLWWRRGRRKGSVTVGLDM